jgi:transcriptional regulator with XRE-family HTH domain
MITEIREILGLSQAEIASLLSVAESTITSWSTGMVPGRYHSSIERIHGLALVLLKEIKPSRIPESVRRKESWLEDRSIIDVITADGVAPIYAYLNRLFEYNR